MSHQSKTYRQVFDILWSISQNQAEHHEINWARRVLSQYLIKVFTLGLVS